MAEIYSEESRVGKTQTKKKGERKDRKASERIEAPHHCGVYQNQNPPVTAPAHHLLHATAPPKPSIIFVLRHCASPPAARRRISHSVSFLLASGCSSSHSLLVVTAPALSLSHSPHPPSLSSTPLLPPALSL
ncbi:hypothetical protein Scep_023563 [Stephania cephalantha]|uniref:Uncharacterized protein n=1 Tax=Stephania cephalantha TaxID=152367 RepID=A0AAP0F227_9MAGN